MRERERGNRSVGVYVVARRLASVVTHGQETLDAMIRGETHAFARLLLNVPNARETVVDDAKKTRGSRRFGAGDPAQIGHQSGIGRDASKQDGREIHARGWLVSDERVVARVGGIPRPNNAPPFGSRRAEKEFVAVRPRRRALHLEIALETSDFARRRPLLTFRLLLCRRRRRRRQTRVGHIGVVVCIVSKRHGKNAHAV